MRKSQRAFMLVAGLLSVCRGAFADGWFDFGPFYRNEKVCYVAIGSASQSHWHVLTYLYYESFGFKLSEVLYKDRDTGEQCTCIAMGGGGGGGVGVNQFAERPHQEDNCHSNTKNGQTGEFDNSTAAGATNQSGGGGSLAGGWGAGPSPLSGALWQESLKTTPASPHLAGRAATGSSAFTYTLPYRALPAGPSVMTTLSSTDPVCNSAINPTYFQIAHVSATVTRYDLCTSAPLATIKVAPLPLQIRVTPDGSQAIVAHYQSAITFIDTATNTVSKTLQTDPSFTPSGIAISPDGSYALITNYETPPDSYLAVLDIASKSLAGTIPLDTEYPQSVYINPDGTLAWVTFPWDNLVEVIDIMTGARVRAFNFDTPYSIAFNATGTVAYIAGGQAKGSVIALDTTTYSTLATIPTDAGSCDLLVSPDEHFVFVNNGLAQSVTVIDADTFTAVSHTTASSPRGAVLVPTQ